MAIVKMKRLRVIAMASCREELLRQLQRLGCVEIREPESAVAYLRGIEAVTGLTCGGIINNTHLCGETTPEEIRKGARLAGTVSEQTGIPVLCHVAEERFAGELSDLSGPVFPITIKMKKPWE